MIGSKSLRSIPKSHKNSFNCFRSILESLQNGLKCFRFILESHKNGFKCHSSILKTLEFVLGDFEPYLSNFDWLF